jgi:hypothetical protein
MLLISEFKEYKQVLLFCINILFNLILTEEHFRLVTELHSGQWQIAVGTACACTIILTIVFYFSLPPSTSNHYHHNSEDYYGDLDLKSIRKSELLAGLNNSQGRSSPPASAPNKPSKPRPQGNQNRPSPPPSQGGEA